MTLDHPALWGIDASLEELRGKKGHLVKCAIQNSKVAWSNFIAKRCNFGHGSRRCAGLERRITAAIYNLSPSPFSEESSLSSLPLSTANRPAPFSYSSLQ